MDKSLLGFRIAGQVGREELQSDSAIEFEVARFVDDAHAAGTKVPKDLVVGDGLADHWNLHWREPILQQGQLAVRR